MELQERAEVDFDPGMSDELAALRAPATVPAAAPAGVPATLGTFSPMDATDLEAAREYAQLLPALRNILILSTSPADWCEFGPKAYPCDAACMKIAGLAGVSFMEPHVDTIPYRDERGPVLMFVAKVMATHRGISQGDEGIASTAEEFFNGSEPDPDNPEKKKARRLPLAEIKVPHVRKKAITNAKVRATRKLLGLYYSIDDVRQVFESAGRDTSRMGSVGFGGKSGEQNATTGKGSMSPVKRQIADMILAMVDPPNDKAKAAEMLWAYTRFTDDKGKEHGCRSVTELSDKWAAKVLPKVKADYDKQQKEGGAA